MIVYDLIIYIILSIMLVYGIHKFLGVFFCGGVNQHRGMQKYFYILYTLFVMFLFTNDADQYNDIGMNIVVLAILIASYKGSIKKKFIVLSLICSIAAVSQTSVVIFLEWSGIEFINKGMEALVIQIPNLCIQYGIVSRFKHIKSLRREFQITYLQWVALVIFPVSSMVLSQVYRQSSVEVDFIMGLLLMMIFNTLIIYIHNQTYRQSLEEIEYKLIREQNEYYEKQLKIIEKEHEEIRILSHDYKNHNILINQYLKKGDLATAITYTEQLLEKRITVGMYSDSGNMGIDSLINYKLHEADKNHIQSEVYVVVPKEMAIKEKDITIILGNLLDNAIEATMRLKEKKEIVVQVVYDKGVLLIAVENTFDGILYSRLDSKVRQLMTRKEDTKNHGLGLRSIDEIAERYKGETRIVHRENRFYASVLLYDYLEV